MQKYYKIGEISKIYGIGADSLRYYEKLGVITPLRAENGYRLYSIDDIFKLNIISELRRLNFPVKKIGDYLQNRTLTTTKILLNEEIQIVKENIDYYKNLEKKLYSKLNSIEQSENENNIGIIKEKYFKERKISYIEENVKGDSEIDFMLKKLQQKYDPKLSLFGNKKIGAGFCLDAVQKNVYNVFSYVFFLLDDDCIEYDGFLEEGTYLCTSYKGASFESIYHLKSLFQYIKLNDLVMINEPIEIYKIDIHETSLEEEYLTEIQILVQKKFSNL